MEKAKAKTSNKKRIAGFFSIAAVFVFVFLAPLGVSAANQSLIFNIDENYDAAGRNETSAVLVKTTNRLYFYVEKQWWDAQAIVRQNEILVDLETLGTEFETRIYPLLTNAFGHEWTPGVDGDPKTAVLFSQMKEGVGGYMRTADEYLKIQVPGSNEKEMVYINTSVFSAPNQLKSFLAHEFMHLVSFNQKDRLQSVSEEIWLNEARADYAPTFLGYDEPYSGSNLEKRAAIFLANPNDPLTEWKNSRNDYGVLTVFTAYLVDHYGIEILTDSLKMKSIGIASLNDAILKNGFKTDFAKIFSDWTVAVFLNDCSYGSQYCYSNKNLVNFRLMPNLNFLPLVGESNLSITNITKNWTGNWQKVVGGNGVLKIEFNGLKGLSYKVPYLVLGKDNNYTINFLAVNSSGKASAYIYNFGTENKALVMMPVLVAKISGFDGLEPTYPFTLSFNINERTPEQEAVLIQNLLVQIERLQAEILKLQTQIAQAKTGIACGRINNQLYFGLMDNSEVRCLQSFLKARGADIYPEGIISGNFLKLTEKAVIRFQEKYKDEILKPFALEKGTGYVGVKTLGLVNKLISQ